MLYALPAFLIVAASLFGCRPEERRLIGIIAVAATVAFAPCLAIALSADRTVGYGFAYALMVVAAVHWAMLAGRRRGDAENGGGSDPSAPLDPGPEPVDWPDFERRFWDEVRRGPGRRSPGGTGRRDRTPV